MRGLPTAESTMNSASESNSRAYLLGRFAIAAQYRTSQGGAENIGLSKLTRYPMFARMSGDPPSSDAPARRVYTISQLNAAARVLLERGLAVVWVEGELSNLSQPASGHWYFTLKDRAAQIRCAMFRQRNIAVGFAPRAGQQLLARGRVGIYEARGDYQLNVEHLEEAGVGALRREFEKLKTKLATEGLFALEHKRPLPAFPQRIGVITSPTAAALRDILHVLARRFAPASVLIYPTPVQGAAAAPGIIAALELASTRGECDVLILARGGGSLEDLWAFNDERVARAIRACALPVVTGIGHEIDFTIADFAADARAPTPSAAAESVVPDRQTWVAALGRSAQRLVAAMRRELRGGVSRLDTALQRLSLAHPGVRLAQQQQRLDDLEQRITPRPAFGAAPQARAPGRRLCPPSAPFSGPDGARPASPPRAPRRTPAACASRLDRACGAPFGSRAAHFGYRESARHAGARLCHHHAACGRHSYCRRRARQGRR